jgi:hypothetical protein
MVMQILGTTVSFVGIVWFCFTLTWDRAGQQQAVLSLWGVVAFIGGLILVALGRIECVMSPPPEQSKRSSNLSLLLLLMVPLVAVGLACLWFLWSSPGQPVK